MAQAQPPKPHHGLFAVLPTGGAGAPEDRAPLHPDVVEDETFGFELLGVFYIGRGDQFDDDRRRTR
jgi:hypothetical protein